MQMYLCYFLLVDSANEIFTIRSNPYFANFDGEPKQDIIHALASQQLPELDFCQRYLNDPKRLAATTPAQWQSRRLSNLHSLLRLNCLTGRLYNHLSHCLVMPWILADYPSASLNLGHPIGAAATSGFNSSADECNLPSMTNPI
jgi:hypothetical protein